jgi:hypothetical protein
MIIFTDFTVYYIHVIYSTVLTILLPVGVLYRVGLLRKSQTVADLVK